VQDVALPLGLTTAMPVDAAREGAQRVWRMGWPFWARRRLRGLRLIATDVDWSAGEGVEVRGPVRALLLLLTGRIDAVRPQLSGPGVDRLAAGGRPARSAGVRRPGSRGWWLRHGADSAELPVDR